MRYLSLSIIFVQCVIYRSLSPLYNTIFIALYHICTIRYLSLSICFVQCVIYRSLSSLYNALFIALYLLCTIRYLSLSITFVQCDIYRSLSPLYNALFIARVGSDDIHPALARINSTDDSLRRGSTLPTIHSGEDQLYRRSCEDQLCRRTTPPQRVYIACHFSTFISSFSLKYTVYICTIIPPPPSLSLRYVSILRIEPSSFQTTPTSAVS